MSEPSSFFVLAKGLMKFAPSLIGSFIAVLSMPSKPDLTFKQKLLAGVIAFSTGMGVSHFAGGAIISYMALPDLLVQDGIKFALGLFGLTLVNNIMSEINPWFISLRQKIFGESK